MYSSEPDDCSKDDQHQDLIEITPELVRKVRIFKYSFWTLRTIFLSFAILIMYSGFIFAGFVFKIPFIDKIKDDTLFMFFYFIASVVFGFVMLNLVCKVGVVDRLFNKIDNKYEYYKELLCVYNYDRKSHKC